MKNKEAGTPPKDSLSSRRSFLKKAAYSAPSLAVLGTLGKPDKSKAGDFGPAPSDPTFD